MIFMKGVPTKQYLTLLNRLEKVCSLKTNRFIFLRAMVLFLPVKNLLSFKLHPLLLDTATLKTYTGNFEGILVSFEKNELYFETKSGHKSKLVALTQTTMKRSDGDEDDIQIEFIKDVNDIVTKIC